MFILSFINNTMKRRNFIQKSLAVGVGASALGVYACSGTNKKKEIEKSPFFKLSLAQWSLHRAIQSGAMSPYDFAAKASELGFAGIEYVSQLYPEIIEAKDKSTAMKNFIALSNQKAKEHQVENLLIMIDEEGDLSVSDAAVRNQTVENHKKWVEAAAEMGCHSIRINLFGEKDEQAWLDASSDGMSKLGTFAAEYNVNVIIENHGLLSSNAALVMKMLDQVNLKNCGTLPDFGNFCLEREEGERWDGSCVREYDRYQGVDELLPRAFAVSAKSHEFNQNGEEVNTDYLRMLKLIKKSGYTGFIGVEYEGSELAEIDGILATKNLLLEKAKLIV